MSVLTSVRDLKTHYLGLANPTRLAIISLLARRELTASELARKLKLSQPLLSWHLRIMRKSALITTRRVGREVHCSLDRKGIREYQDRFNQFISENDRSAASRGVPAALVNEEIANAI